MVWSCLIAAERRKGYVSSMSSGCMKSRPAHSVGDASGMRKSCLMVGGVKKSCLRVGGMKKSCLRVGGMKKSCLRVGGMKFNMRGGRCWMSSCSDEF